MSKSFLVRNSYWKYESGHSQIPVASFFIITLLFHVRFFKPDTTLFGSSLFLNLEMILG